MQYPFKCTLIFLQNKLLSAGVPEKTPIYLILKLKNAPIRATLYNKNKKERATLDNRASKITQKKITKIKISKVKKI